MTEEWVKKAIGRDPIFLGGRKSKAAGDHARPGGRDNHRRCHGISLRLLSRPRPVVDFFFPCLCLLFVAKAVVVVAGGGWLVPVVVL